MTIFNMKRNSRAEATKQAAVWLARHEAGTIDEADFEVWRSADPAHAVAFVRALAAWNAAGTPLEHAEPSLFTRRKALFSAAAFGMAGLATAGGFATQAYAWESASSKIGETRRIILPDGSRAMLNTDSVLQWRFSRDERSLWIERGEVALELERGIPAQVNGLGRVATLTSGRFNVRLEIGSMDVTVLRGRAIAGPREPGSSADRGITATSTEGLLLSAALPSVRAASTEQLAAAVAWQQGEILFDNEPLQSAVREYNRYLDHKIVIADPVITDTLVGGRFTTRDPEAFLFALDRGLGIRVTPRDGTFVLTR